MMGFKIRRGQENGRSNGTMAHVEDVFDPFGLDEHEEEKAALSFNPFPEPTTVADRMILLEQEQHAQQPQHQQSSSSTIPTIGAVDPKPQLIPPPPPTVNRVARSSSAKALPPKISVKLVVREDATAMAIAAGAGASHVNIVGTIQAQIQCSDATKNAPFLLKMEPLETMEINEEFVNEETLQVYIPKHEIGLVRILEFAVQQHIQRMPLLLERKISIKERTCRISIQVRSKLANKGDLKDLSIAIAVPMEVDGESISILRGGDGIYDELRRIVHWRLDELKRGASLMVAAEAQLWETPPQDAKLEFPVILRANSTEDKISEVDCRVVPAEGHPSSVTFTQSHSFRLLYRLQ